MNLRRYSDRRFFEIMLIVIILAMTSLLAQMHGHKMVILNLFFLPVVLSGYYLGRNSAGTLAVLAAVSVTIAMTLDSAGFMTSSSPLVVGLAVTAWAAVLGLTALLVGTLCDERAAKVEELHAAYVGVVEVLAKYLQSANPRVKARAVRVAELSQALAKKLRLSRKQVDDVRVGALLYDIGNVEITTKLITRAVDSVEAQSVSGKGHTFQGMELVHSLEPVLSGAVPLLLNQDDAVHDCLASESGTGKSQVPLGARIIRTVRAYDALVQDGAGGGLAPEAALAALRRDRSAYYDEDVLATLARCVSAESVTVAELDEQALAL